MLDGWACSIHETGNPAMVVLGNKNDVSRTHPSYSKAVRGLDDIPTSMELLDTAGLD